MNEGLKKIQQLRVALLKKVYELTNGSTAATVNGGEVAAQIGLNNGEENQLRDAADYLEAEGLLKVTHVMGRLPGFVQLTHAGLKEIEAALAAPDKPTEHLMAINFLNIGQVIGSNVQQGTIGSSQTLNLNPEALAQIKAFLANLSQSIRTLSLDTNDKTELEADVNTLKSQVESPKPKPTIVRDALSSIKRILEGAAGGAIGDQLAKQIPTLLAMLS